MATLAPPRVEAHSPEAAKTRQPDYAQPAGWQHFWLRRLHSLLGILFGGYVVVHLVVNATGLSPNVYQRNVDKIHDLEPMLPLIEILFIFLPILFHLVYGVYIAKAGTKYNTFEYNYGGNVRYFLQRVTAYILTAFVLYHIITLHKWGLGHFKPDNQAFQSTVGAIQRPFDSLAGNVLIMIFYLLGVWSATFHFANGLWTAAIAWGLTVTANAQRRWGHVCLALGIALTLVGTVALAAFTVAPAAQGDLTRWDDQTYTREPHSAQQTHGYKTGGKNPKTDRESVPPTGNPAGTQGGAETPSR